MHFIIISKKDKTGPKINEKLLNSLKAPALIAREAIKYEINNFIIYIYPYNHIDHELEGYSYYCDDDKFLLINGMVNVNNDLRNQDIVEFFSELEDSSELFGDYQIINLDRNGNGFIKTPSLSIRQLFFYEDENCAVLSTDMKLIVDGITKFKSKRFVDHFDVDFVEDSLFREWTSPPRNFPEKTIFKEIKRIFPQDIKYFKEGEIIIERHDSIQIPQWFRNLYSEDKTKLYDDYYEFLMNFAETNLVNLKPNIKLIRLGLSGGFDSRLSVAILSKICRKHEIPFECYVGGQDEHPDVVLAKKVADALDVEIVHYKPQGNLSPNPTDYTDYATIFYMSWGDFNSKDFVLNYNRQVDGLDVILQHGMDAYKRTNMILLLSANRWFARRILFKRNFYFPLFFTDYEVWFAFLSEELGQRDSYKEFVYEVLKRSMPQLLDIPFAGQSLPQVDVEPYLGLRDSKHHEKEPFLWDYAFVQENLKPLLSKNDLGTKGKLLLNLLRISELDYFLNKELGKKIGQYRKKQITLLECVEELIKERNSMKYPKTKTKISFTKEAWDDFYIPKMQILMDFASVADKRSFEEVEDITYMSKT
jgi:hypothetical protein